MKGVKSIYISHETIYQFFKCTENFIFKILKLRNDFQINFLEIRYSNLQQLKGTKAIQKNEPQMSISEIFLSKFTKHFMNYLNINVYN